eukprot:Sspe_Gene.82394::Locus_54004_Transcript_1_2_Confidence_0.667_Length_1574::g.82394::m.82394
MQMRCVLVLAALVGGAVCCVHPGTCTPPPAKYKNELPLSPRKQWGDSGGYCGSLSVQSGALYFGAWISQEQVRKATDHGEGHGNPEKGYEILPTNIEQALRNLHLTYDAFDYNQTKPQAPAYKAFLKRHLVASHPVVWFVMCRGDGDQIPYPGSNPNNGRFSHIEPVWGIYSNHSFDDLTVYDDDVLVHGSDWDQEGYYRAFHTLVDEPSMDGNCRNAGNFPGVNEMYPCIYSQVDYGYAITGFEDPKKVAKHAVLAVDSWDEPDMNNPLKRPSDMHGKLTISGLVAGKEYTVYRFNGRENVPTDSNYDHGYEHKYTFVAQGAQHTWEDPNTFKSNSATFYRVV